MTTPSDPAQQSPPPGFGPPPYAYGQPPGYGQPMYGNDTGRPANGLGTAGLICGILAIVLSISIIGGFVLGILGLIFGLIGRRRVAQGQATNGGAALAGAICGGLGLLASIVLIIAGASLLSHNRPDLDQLNQCITRASTLPADQRAAANAQCNKNFADNFHR